MAKKKQELPTKKIAIPPPSFQMLMVEFVGDSPLMTNRMSDDQVEDLERRAKKEAALDRGARDIDREWQEKCYKLEGGMYGFRAVGIKKSIATIAKRFNGVNKTEMNGVIFVVGPFDGFVPIIGPPPHCQRDVVGWKKTVIYRPVWDEWRMIVPIRLITNFLSADELINAISMTGIMGGIGTWRTENGGDKGAFHVGSINEIKASTNQEQLKALLRSAWKSSQGRGRGAARRGNRQARAKVSATRSRKRSA